MLDDDAGRLLSKLVDTFQCRIGIVDVVVGKRLTLQLYSGGNTGRFAAGFNIKGSRLMRVFTVTEFLPALELWCDIAGQGICYITISTALAEVSRYQAIIAGCVGKGFCSSSKRFSADTEPCVRSSSAIPA